MSSDDMRDEYDFSKAARGKFHRPNASLAPPIHVEPEVLAFRWWVHLLRHSRIT